jgi:hypothetical protein
MNDKKSLSDFILNLDLCDVAGKVFKNNDGEACVQVKWMLMELRHVDLNKLSAVSGISVKRLIELIDGPDLTDEERRSLIDGAAAMIKAQPYAIPRLHGPESWGE